MTSLLWRAGALGLALATGACGSTRFGGPAATGAAPRANTLYNAPAAEPEPVPAMPSGPVVAEPLPPPPGAPGPVAALPPAGGPAEVPVMPGSPRPVEGFGAPAAAPGPAPTSRSAFVGGWTAREASGTSCRVQLSSASAIDLYKASASGCANRDLARVTAWDFRDGEVYLYQPGGAVAARLRAGPGSLDGVLAKSGAPLALSR